MPHAYFGRMRVFVAGATGAIGRFLLPALVSAGHEVAGMTRRQDRAAALAAAGATAVVCDIHDARLADVVSDFEPEVVVHQVTHLPAAGPALLPLTVHSLNRARTDGTDALIAAARVAGASRFVAQSTAFWLPHITQKAVDYLEAATLAYPGVVLRYGYFYGPGTWYAGGPKHKPPVSIEYAAARTVELLTAEPGVYEVTDPR